MRALVLLPLSLLAVAHADVLFRSEVRSPASSGFAFTAEVEGLSSASASSMPVVSLRSRFPRTIRGDRAACAGA